jgi:hypothetical protein
MCQNFITGISLEEKILAAAESMASGNPQRCSWNLSDHQREPEPSQGVQNREKNLHQELTYLGSISYQKRFF